MNNLIIKTELLKDIGSKILFAIDTEEKSVVTDTLQIRAKDGILEMCVTNGEYFVRVSINNTEGDLFATVNAKVFLKLLSMITTDTISLSVNDTVLIIKANGTYKLPIVFEGKDVYTLPEITITNKISTANISSSTLKSILQYNSKEFLKNNKITRNYVQELYYIDSEGAITFTNGACVNNFSVSTNFKVLLTQKLVKLFKLFTSDFVSVSLGSDIENGVTLSKIQFISNNIEITSIIPNPDELVSKIPVTAIRDRAYKDYPYTVSLDKSNILAACNRINILSSDSSVENIYSLFEFTDGKLYLYDMRKENKEEVAILKKNVDNFEYSFMINLEEFIISLNVCESDVLVFSFGDKSALVINDKNIRYILPEAVLD